MEHSFQNRKIHIRISHPKENQVAGPCLWIMEQLQSDRYIQNIKIRVYGRPSHVEGLSKDVCTPQNRRN